MLAVGCELMSSLPVLGCGGECSDTVTFHWMELPFYRDALVLTEPRQNGVQCNLLRTAAPSEVPKVSVSWPPERSLIPAEGRSFALDSVKWRIQRLLRRAPETGRQRGCSGDFHLFLLSD